MSANTKHDCPHCGTVSVSFRFIAETANPNHAIWHTVFACGRCSGVVVFPVFYSNHEQGLLRGKNGDFVELLRGSYAEIQPPYPSIPAADVPLHIPDAARRALVQAHENHRLGHADAAGAMFRKVIEVSTRALDPELANKNLVGRINALAERNKLTPELKAWAHKIRLDGNSAVHDDEEMSEADVDQLAKFTTLFLTYTFTLPKQIEAAAPPDASA